MNVATYNPFLWARTGEIEAIGRLRPAIQQAVTPVLDFPTQRKNDKMSLRDYLAEKVVLIAKSWGTQYPLYFDFSRFEPHTYLPSGHHIVDEVFELARQCRVKAMPVAGLLAARGPSYAYLDSIDRVAKKDRRGFGLRLSLEDFSTPEALAKSIDEVLTTFSKSVPSDIAVMLDAESLQHLPEDNLSLLSAQVRHAAVHLNSLGFRSITFVATSLPDSSARYAKGTSLRTKRTEFQLWRYLVATTPTLLFGDYAIGHPRQTDPSGPVIPPSRVRLSTEDEFIFHKAAQSEIRKVSSDAMSTPEFLDQELSWGANSIRECAVGYGDPGNATSWVARDTNMHLSSTVASIQKYAPLPPEHAADSNKDRTTWLQEALLPFPKRD